MFPQFFWFFWCEVFAPIRLPWRGGPHTSAELTNDSRSSTGMQQVAFPLPDGSHSYRERTANTVGRGPGWQAMHSTCWWHHEHCQIYKASVSQGYKVQAILSWISKWMTKALRNFYKSASQECTGECDKRILGAGSPWLPQLGPLLPSESAF